MRSQILIVDDNALLADTIAMVLADEGFAVRVAPTGRAALFALHDQPVDLIVSDVMMPELSGLDLVRVLRLRGDETPVILMSSDAVGAPLPQGVQFLSKPFDLDTMISSVEAALDG